VVVKAALAAVLVVLIALLVVDASVASENLKQSEIRYVQWCGAQITNLTYCEQLASQVSIAVLVGGDADCAFAVMREVVDGGEMVERLDLERCAQT
jgi:hypothetical protein